MTNVTFENVINALIYIIATSESLVDDVKDKKLLDYGEIIGFQYEIDYCIGVLRKNNKRFPLYIEKASKKSNILARDC